MFNDFFQKTLLGNSMAGYFIFAAIFLTGVSIIFVLKKIVLHRLKAWSERTSTTIDDFLIGIFEKRLIPFLYLGVLYLSFGSLALNPSIRRFIDITGIVVLTYVGLHLISALISYSIETYWIKREADTGRRRSLAGIITILKVVVWGIGITFLLDNLGFRISTVVAGLGIGGIAVALAAQTILGDLFSYFVIFFDRPFEIGDFIIIDNYLGTIEYIGIKTTRVRSLGGEQLIFSNTDLTNARLRNYKRMEKRRVVFRIGVVYRTPTGQLKEIPGIIRQSIEKVEDTVFDRAHFASYGDFSLIFEAVYYVLSSDYNKYMDSQQEINFTIKDEFEKRGIEFAYPTQTVYLEKADNGWLAGPETEKKNR